MTATTQDVLYISLYIQDFLLLNSPPDTSGIFRDCEHHQNLN